MEEIEGHDNSIWKNQFEFIDNKNNNNKIKNNTDYSTQMQMQMMNVNSITQTSNITHEYSNGRLY